MELKVDFKPEDINKAIAEAVAQSLIGQEVERVIKAKVAELSKSYNNPIESVVAQMIQQMIRDVINEKYKEQLKAYISEQLTEQATQEWLDKLCKAPITNTN